MKAATPIPHGSVVSPLQAHADFWDAFNVTVQLPKRSAMHWYLDFAGRTPRWIDVLMRMRNRAVRLVGLKDVGQLAHVPPTNSAASLRPGQRVGIFTIRSVCDEEVVFEILDKHLDVVMSVYRGAVENMQITVTTLVFNHNWLGRLYMIPVTPMHKIVVKSILAKGRQHTTS
ncbi:MAG: DUF2867 domain-containing protein [Pseudomonadota bacterium]|nr:DUF2867 domain-containing protein [Pseudomonadota bacterium]